MFNAVVVYGVPQSTTAPTVCTFRLCTLFKGRLAICCKKLQHSPHHSEVTHIASSWFTDAYDKFPISKARVAGEVMEQLK